MNKAKKDSKKIDVMSLIEHSLTGLQYDIPPRRKLLDGKRKKRKKKWGSGPVTLTLSDAGGGGGGGGTNKNCVKRTPGEPPTKLNQTDNQ